MKKVLALLAVGLLVAADKPKADDATEELKKLAGTWTLVSEVADGQEQDAFDRPAVAEDVAERGEGQQRDHHRQQDDEYVAGEV